MPFKPLQPDQEVRVHRGHLPHWRQDDVSYFVACRLADSMPREKLREWKNDRQAWLEQHEFASASELENQATGQVRHSFHDQFTSQWHQWLDAGYGSCVLRNPPIRQLLVTRMTAGKTSQYDLDAWVVMPNHFHTLVTPRPGITLGRVIQLWKGGSSREINLALGRKGPLWQAEPFDHIVRSEAQWQHYRRYITENPIKPGLKGEEYSAGLGQTEWKSARDLRDYFQEEEGR